MVFDELFQSLQQFLTQFVPGYVFVKTFHFFNKQKSDSFEGTAVASIAISYVINLVVSLFVKTDNSRILIPEVVAVVVAFVCAICIVKIKTMGYFGKCSQWIGKKSDNDNIWEELFDVNKGSTIRCYAKFKNEDAMITGAIKYYDVRDDAGRLKFSRDDLVVLNVYHARQLTSPIIKTNLSIYTGDFEVYRIGDTLTDKLSVPADYRDRIKGIRKFCTKPELEMLLLIAEGKDAEFEKVKAGKNSKDAKAFCKANVVHNRKRYDNSTQFYWDYFGSDIDTLVEAIKKYKQTHGAHKKGEGYLADLLK